jgi:hypothetical protein
MTRRGNRRNGGGDVYSYGNDKGNGNGNGNGNSRAATGTAKTMRTARTKMMAKTTNTQQSTERGNGRIAAMTAMVMVTAKTTTGGDNDNNG